MKVSTKKNPVITLELSAEEAVTLYYALGLVSEQDLQRRHQFQALPSWPYAPPYPLYKGLSKALWT